MMTGGRNVMKTEFKVQGMTCGGCERSVQNALSAFNDFSEAYQTSVDQPIPLFRRREKEAA